ncbi:assimilatory sulfite reductase (NADPH) flavoprotein subunit [Pseudochelatococcus sp. B33]
MGVSEFRGPGLSAAQWEQIRALAASLDAKQLLWVSGFFAGIEHRAGDTLSETPAAPVASQTLTILYGSETGNSAALATSLAGQFEARGRAARLIDMADYKIRELKDEQDLLIVASTYGEGDPPQPAAGFFDFVEGRKAPKFTDLRFAVLALGDSTYEHFCEAGKRLDRRFEELGGVRVRPRVDCDVDYDEAAAAWSADIVALWGNAGSEGGHAPRSRTPAALAGTPGFDKRNLFPARVIDNIVLTGRGSSKETRHVELSLEGSNLGFEPGDALGVMPSNDPQSVDAILAALGIAGSDAVTVKDASITVAEALTHRFEIAALTPRFIEQWAALSGADALKRLAEPDHASERARFMHDHHVIDVMRLFPVRHVSADQFIAALRPLQPRLYSIASSLAAAPGEVHLTVSTVRYTLFGEERTGVASGHLANRGAVDGVLPVYVQANPHFRLPADDAPIIMIGAGTGVAPYRAFMQEREAGGAAGRSWLFFGERNFRTDFLYQTEWQAWLKDGVLSRMDVAFSRDVPDARTYVQHRLLEQARDVFAWLEEGAHLYVCGDASRLAPDVHATLRTIIVDQGGLGPAGAGDYLARLRDGGRYKLDVY